MLYTQEGSQSSYEPTFPSVEDERSEVEGSTSPSFVDDADVTDLSPLQEEESVEEDASQAAEEERKVLASYMDSYVSIMRIKFAWMAFILVVVLLIVDLFILFSIGVKTLNITAISVMVGVFLGMLIGMMYYHVVNSKKIIGEIEGAKQDKTKRFDNLRLMIWRGYGHWVWQSMLLGGVIGGLSSHIHVCMGYESNIEFTNLHDQVIIALIVSTTASVIGILLIVMYWLFPKK